MRVVGIVIYLMAEWNWYVSVVEKGLNDAEMTYFVALMVEEYLFDLISNAAFINQQFSFDKTDETSIIINLNGA
jgi:hypothetical protein